MSIDYEREGKRENPNKVDAEWPQLIVPEWTNKGQRTTKPGRRAAQSKQETTGRQRTVRSESTVSKKKEQLRQRERLRKEEKFQNPGYQLLKGKMSVVKKQ